MYSYADISSYYRKYCSYYQTLEADFVATERYLTIDEDNFFAFSNDNPSSLSVALASDTICSDSLNVSSPIL